MRLGIISDEVNDDFEAACGRIRSFGLDHVEVRQAWGRNVVQLDDDQVGRAVDVVRRLDLNVTAIASPVFKSPLDERPQAQAADFAVPGSESMDAQLAMLERACELANRFGTRFVRIFTFLRVPWSDDVATEVTDKLIRAAEVARRHDVVLAIENEPVCIVGSGAELGRLCALLNDRLPHDLKPHVGALWDPGNALAMGEERPYPDGYDALAGCRLVHVHLKDLGQEPATFGSFVPIGRGRIDYRAQFAALRRDGYDGAVVLEPHYAPPHLSRDEAARECVDAAQAELAAAASATA